MREPPHPTDLRVGQLLRERRMLLGMSQERLGALLGVTYQQVQKYERGANRIGSSRLQDLCRVLGVPITYFFAAGAGARGLDEAAAPFVHDVEPPAADHGARETLELVRAFARIDDASVRRRVLDLVRALGETPYRKDAGRADGLDP